MKRYIRAASTNIKILDKAARIRLFGEDPQGDIVIPDDITVIDSAAFKSCHNIESVTIPNNVIEIKSDAFSYCTALTSISFPVNLDEISKYVCFNCVNLSSVTIPEGVTQIRESAFENCASLQAITIPESVAKIGSTAFYNCKSLTSVDILNDGTHIAKDAFMLTPLDAEFGDIDNAIEDVEDNRIETDFDLWYEDWVQSTNFISLLTDTLIADEPEFAHIEEEPSIQGMDGQDVFYITWKDGSTDTVSVDWRNLVEFAYENGDEVAAEFYAEKIIESIE